MQILIENTKRTFKKVFTIEPHDNNVKDLKMKIENYINKYDEEFLKLNNYSLIYLGFPLEDSLDINYLKWLCQNYPVIFIVFKNK